MTILERMDAAIAAMHAELKALEPEPPKRNATLRYTVENINGVTVIVGMVEPPAEP